MIEQEQRLARKVRFMVIGAMTLFFVLATTLTFLLAVRINQNNRIDKLESQNAYLSEQIENAGSAKTYYENIIQFAEDYALRVRGWGRPGSKIFG